MWGGVTTNVPCAVFELGLSAGCVVSKEMAEWFCSGCWEGMGTDEQKLTVPSSCAQGQEQKKKGKSNLADCPWHWPGLWADVHWMPSWCSDRRCLGKWALLWGWLFLCAALLCIRKTGRADAFHFSAALRVLEWESPGVGELGGHCSSG